MGREYTDKQKDAIEDRGHTLLVSAAAGSGKTTVLIDRIVGMITDEKEPMELSSLLVVTFTKASAAEIRDRLTVALSKALARDPQSKRLLRQLASVPSAKIGTMDSFFLDVIKKNFDKAGLSATFVPCEETASKEMLASACEELLEEYYASSPEGSTFFELMENLSGEKSDSNFTGALISLYLKIYSFADPEDYLDACADEYGRIASGELEYTESSLYKPVAEDMEIFFSHALENMTEAIGIIRSEPKMGNSIVLCTENVYGTLVSLCKAKGYEQIYKAVSSFEKAGQMTFPKDFDPETKKFINSAKAETVELIEKVRKLFCLSKDDLCRTCADYARYAGLIKELLKKLDDKFTALKRSRGVISLSDMKRICFGLLFDKKGTQRVPSALCAEIAKDYKEIFIDEYQDTDEIQDMIFSSIARLSGAHRFMVGDMKQCIYAFRGSEPKLFASYYDAFPFLSPESTECAKIALADNFRSDASVVSFVNLVFRSLMRKRISDMDYSDDQALIKGKKEDKLLPVELLITDKSTEQARVCAREISRLIQSGEYAPEDIAILARNNNQLGAYRKALAELDIEVNGKENAGIFNSAEIRLIRSVLHAVDNPARDVHLAAALCSPVFGLTLTQLASIRFMGNGSLYEALCSSSEPCAVRAVKYLDELKKFSLSCGIDKLIFKIIKDSGLDRAVKKEKNGKRRYNNLLTFIGYCRSYDNGSYRGLSDFLSYCDRLEKTNPPSADAMGSGVTLSTMHSAKGLEFKVCFVAGCEKELFSNNGRKDIIFDSKTPFAFALKRQNAFVSVKTPPVFALAHLSRYKPVSEELRLLYVALTRAKEKLYISFEADHDKLSDHLDGIDREQNPASDYFILNAKDQRELILRGIAAGRRESLEQIFYRDKGIGDQLKIRFIGEDGKEQTEAAGSKPAKTEVREYECYPDYVYPHTGRSLIPAKLSVSDINADGEREFPKTAGELPSFMASSHASAAQIGTAMHSFMQFCDYERAELSVKDEAKRLSELGFISRADADIINCETLSRFFESGLYRELKSARRIYREQRYNLSESASKYFDSHEAKGQSLLVQGVIDCFFENAEGEIVLIDFKTDRVNKKDGAQILRERHTPQLELYAKAVELMTKKKLARAYVYSFALEREIQCI